MSFSVSWAKVDGDRVQLECADAKEVVGKIIEAGGPGLVTLKIKDSGGVPLTLEQLAILAAQVVDKNDEPSDKN